MQDVADLAFGGDGYLYVNSRNASAVLRFDAVTGAFAGRFTSYDRGIDGFSGVFEVAHVIPEPAVMLAAAAGLFLARRRRDKGTGFEVATAGQQQGEPGHGATQDGGTQSEARGFSVDGAGVRSQRPRGTL
jgi:hypothetical protein